MVECFYIKLLCMIPLLIIRKNIGITWFLPTKKQSLWWFVVIFLAYIRWWAFGGWLWVVISYATLFLFWFTILQGKATGIIPSMIMNISAIVAFVMLWISDWTLWILIFIWMTMWWILWSSVAIHKWNARLKYLLIFFILVSSIKLLYPYVF